MGLSPGTAVCLLGAGMAQVVTAVTVWLRQRGRERLERGRLDHLVTAARELPPGARLRERFADGGSLAVAVGGEAGERR